MKTSGLAHLLPAIVLGLSGLVVAPAARAQVGALQTDCGLGGVRGDGAYQFVATCAGRAPSPDARFAVVQKAYEDEQPPIELQNAHGHVLAALPSLSDDMPFSVSWSPNSRWFFVNHHVGSFMDELQVFEIVGETAVERPALARSAVKIATARYPCLPPDQVLPNGARWTRDGRGIVLVTISRPDACAIFKSPGRWRSLWMIGDVDSGLVSSASIRVQPEDKPLRTPTDGPYAKR